MNTRRVMEISSAIVALVLALEKSALAQQRSSRKETVTAAAARLEAPAGGSSGSIQVVTAAQIAAAAAPDVKAALALAPGLLVTDSGGPGGVATLSLRGSGSHQVLVLLDGRRVADAQSTSFNVNDLPLPVERIERIEVMPHPASVLYGADALGGVVNIVTRPVGATPGLALSLGIGDEDERRLAGGVQYGVGKLGLRLDGQLRTGDGFRDNGDFDLRNAAAVLRVEPAPWGLDLRWSTLEREAGVPGPEASPSPEARRKDSRDALRADVTYDPGSRWDVQAGVFSQRQSLESEDDAPPEFAAGTIAEPIPGSHDSRSHGVEARLNFDTGAGELYTVGGEWVVDRVKGTADGDHESDRWSVFAQDQWSYRNWSAVGAVRRDEHSVHGDRTTLSASGGWKSGGWRFSGSWAQGFRAPGFDDLYRDEQYIQGDPDLKPETSATYEGSAELGGSEGRMRLNVFRRSVSDLIRWADPDGDSVYRPENVPRVLIGGWEAEALYRPSATIEIPVSYQRLSVEDEDTGERLGGSVRSLWRVALQSTGSSFAWSVDYTVTDRARLQLSDGSLGYAVLNAALSWRHTFSSAALQVSLRAENLRDRDYQSVEGYPQRGRSVYAQVRVEL